MHAKGIKFQLYDDCDERYLNSSIKSFEDADKVNYKTFYRPDDLTVNNSIKSGKYRGGLDLTLNLKENGDYSLRIDSVYVSKGRWGIKDNKVILFD